MLKLELLLATLTSFAFHLICKKNNVLFHTLIIIIKLLLLAIHFCRVLERERRQKKTMTEEVFVVISYIVFNYCTISLFTFHRL